MGAGFADGTIDRRPGAALWQTPTKEVSIGEVALFCERVRRNKKSGSGVVAESAARHLAGGGIASKRRNALVLFTKPFR
jgi:hypothetical protein